jgi:hypothetical protein
VLAQVSQAMRRLTQSDDMWLLVVRLEFGVAAADSKPPDVTYRSHHRQLMAQRLAAIRSDMSVARSLLTSPSSRVNRVGITLL